MNSTEPIHNQNCTACIDEDVPALVYLEFMTARGLRSIAVCGSCHNIIKENGMMMNGSPSVEQRHTF